jgi:AcrR family transcriptional regulator
MPSDSKKPKNALSLRREPQRPRGKQRVHALLDTAAAVIVERGYADATMTEIAQRAGTSIGTIYQYFPHKAALAFALRQRYGEELGQRWSEFLAKSADLNTDELVIQLIELMVLFARDFPAYLLLLNVTAGYKRDHRARTELRQQMSFVLQRRAPHLAADAAYTVANVVVEILKSFHRLMVNASAAERESLEREFRFNLGAYLRWRLQPASSHSDQQLRAIGKIRP